MTITVLDKDSRLFKGMISEFESFIWTERYWDFGDFELIIPLNARNVSLVDQNDYLRISTSETLMIVEDIEISSPLVDEGGKITLSGRSLGIIIERRILLKDFKSSLAPEAFILQLMNNAFGEKAEENRKINYLLSEDNTDEDIETESVKINENKGANLADIILPAVQNAELGIKISFDPDTLNFLFSIYNGKDKSYISFNERNLQLQEAKLYLSNSNFKTAVLVQGSDGESIVELTDEKLITGINRRETYVSATDISKEVSNYRHELELRGKNELEEYKTTKTIDGRLMNFGSYKLRRDFDLGDLVTIQNNYFNAVARITEVIQSWDYANGYQIYPGFIIKEINLINVKSEYKPYVPEEPADPRVDPVLPDDQNPVRLINVELISAIKMYTNIEAGRTSGKAYQQIYIPNIQTGEESRPIKKFAVRLRGLIPEGLDASIYSIFCDVFLGSQQKVGTVSLGLKKGVNAYSTNWFNYPTYDSSYIRLYFYVVNNLSETNVLIGPEEHPYIDGFVDIKLNGSDAVTYEPSEEGDELTYQVGYYWEENANFNKYYIGNSTNVNGIDGVEIFVKRAAVLGNESVLEFLGSSVTDGNRGYEYDTVNLDNVTTTSIASGVATVPPYEQNFKIPPFGDNIVEQSCQSLGFRDNVFEYIERAGTNYLLGKGNNLQEVNMVFRGKKKYPITPDRLINVILSFHLDSDTYIFKASPDRLILKHSVTIYNENSYIKTLTYEKTGNYNGITTFIYLDGILKKTILKDTDGFDLICKDSTKIKIEQTHDREYLTSGYDISLNNFYLYINKTDDITEFTNENYNIYMEYENMSNVTGYYGHELEMGFGFDTSVQKDSADLNEKIVYKIINDDVSLIKEPFEGDGSSYNGVKRGLHYGNRWIISNGPVDYIPQKPSINMFTDDFKLGSSETNKGEVDKYLEYIEHFPKTYEQSIEVPKNLSYRGCGIFYGESVKIGNYSYGSINQIRNTKYEIKYSYQKEI